MTEIEIDQVMRLLGDFFSSFAESSPGEIGLWRLKFRDENYVDAKKAIEDHKLSTKFDRVRFPDIFDRIRATKRSAAPPGQTPALKDQNFADILRRGDRQFAGMGDYEVIIRHFRGLWCCRAKPRIERCRPEDRPECEAGYRKQIREGCLNHLAALGMIGLDANGVWSTEWPEVVAEAVMSEDVTYFDQVLRDVLDGAPKTTESPVWEGSTPQLALPAPHEMPVGDVARQRQAFLGSGMAGITS